MKTCPVCALVVDDMYLFCADDGSSLRAFSGTSVDNSEAIPFEVDNDTDGAVVLYCPACAAEYPLTFSECPTHGVKLTTHNISRPTNKATAAEPELKQPAAAGANQPTDLDLSRTKAQAPGRSVEVALAESAAGFDYSLRNPVPFDQEFGTESNYSDPPIEPGAQGFERPGFRVAAIATVIVLSIFALAGMYGFFSNVSRRPSAPVVRIAEAAPQPFVPTPQEALDYQEQPPPAASKLPESPSDRTVEQKNRDDSSTLERSARKKAAEKSDAKPLLVSRTEALNSPPGVSLPPLPRGNSGGFDARLIRVRSSKTTSGFRYDLTFNMQEQAGRSAQWQRVLVTTRSVSGVNHSQAIPFAHRLGAAGALTFTISVELAGHSETDWQGRVVCTTLGWDNQGAPLQASFGANLTP